VKDPAVRAAIVAQATSSETLKADEKRPTGERTPGLSAATERFNRGRGRTSTTWPLWARRSGGLRTTPRTRVT